MRTILILIAALLTSSAHAATPAEQACVLKAADTLPKIQGMKIGKGRASTAEGAPPGFLRVDIDWEAAGQRATWFYLCAVDGNGNARVQRLAK
jgi:hypothetical protein